MIVTDLKRVQIILTLYMTLTQLFDLDPQTVMATRMAQTMAICYNLLIFTTIRTIIKHIQLHVSLVVH